MLKRITPRYLLPYLQDFPEGQKFSDRFSEIKEELGLGYKDIEEMTTIGKSTLSKFKRMNGTRLKTIYKIAIGMQRIPLALYYKGTAIVYIPDPTEELQFFTGIGMALRNQRYRLEELREGLTAKTMVSESMVRKIEAAKPTESSTLERICQGLEMIPLYLMQEPLC